ncbi:MAG: hypothetical protein Q4F76_07485 [Lachnospiraceae bacterium]|nr:hypothetical protein [Lachnospiraceae bacterium]
MNKLDDQSIGETFIKRWYGLIDRKAPISEILPLTVGDEIQVDFPNNPLDWKGFQTWYEGQCRDFTGQHILHTVKVEMKNEEMEIFSEITWKAVDKDGRDIQLFPNVILRLKKEDGFKVYYYGCTDRK